MNEKVAPEAAVKLTATVVFGLFSALDHIDSNKDLLFQNYPNPFNPSTKISWQVPVGGWQTLKIYDLLGNEVATLVDEYKPVGSYDVEFNIHSGEGRNLARGRVLLPTES